MDNIFKSLSKQYSSTVTSLHKLKERDKGGEKELLLLDKKELLEELLDYMKSYKWLYKNNSKSKVQTYIESGFDYEVLCEKCSISYSNAVSSIKWASSQFKKKIGENTLKLIRAELIDEARTTFYVKSGKMSRDSLIIKDGLEILPKAKFDIFSLADCEKELKILRLISKTMLSQYEKIMDKDKMAYLLWLLEGDSKKCDLFRPYLVLLLNNELSAGELIEMEPEIKAQQSLI